MGSLFPDRDRIHVPCIGGQILNHWTTRGVPFSLFYSLVTVVCFGEYSFFLGGERWIFLKRIIFFFFNLIVVVGIAFVLSARSF